VKLTRIQDGRVNYFHQLADQLPDSLDSRSTISTHFFELFGGFTPALMHSHSHCSNNLAASPQAGAVSQHQEIKTVWSRNWLVTRSTNGRCIRLGSGKCECPAH
jgi:hypothetical protein